MSASIAMPATVRAQSTLPYGTIRIFIGYPSSGGSDSMVHIIAGALQQQIGRAVAIDFKPGPSGAGTLHLHSLIWADYSGQDIHTAPHTRGDPLHPILTTF